MKRGCAWLLCMLLVLSLLPAAAAESVHFEDYVADLYDGVWVGLGTCRAFLPDWEETEGTRVSPEGFRLAAEIPEQWNAAAFAAYRDTPEAKLYSINGMDAVLILDGDAAVLVLAPGVILTAEPMSDPDMEAIFANLVTTIFREEDLPAILRGEQVAQESVRDYVLNKNSHKFHIPQCDSVDDIKAKNRLDFQGTRSEIIEMGYSPCRRCHP